MIADIGASSVSLLVVRGQGLVGPVTVEWTTVDGTALSSGKIHPDFVVRTRLGRSECYIEMFCEYAI